MDPPGPAALFSREVIHPSFQYIHLGHSLEEVIDFAAARWKFFQGMVDSLDLLSWPQCAEKVVLEAVRQYYPMVAADREEGWLCAGVEVRKESPSVRLGEARYVTRVDALEERDGEQRVVEVKFSTREQNFPWGLDNQLLGHAECFGVDEVMLVEVLAKKAARAVSVTVLRQIVHVQPDLVREWREETESEMSDLWVAWGGDSWPKNTSACLSYGRTCVYLDFCRAGRLREGMFPSQHGQQQAAQEVVQEAVEE
jgi:hypothetical protein